VPARPGLALEHGYFVALAEQPRCAEPGDAAADYGNL
jgi:hypothetical protein